MKEPSYERGGMSRGGMSRERRRATRGIVDRHFAVGQIQVVLRALVVERNNFIERFQQCFGRCDGARVRIPAHLLEVVLLG